MCILPWFLIGMVLPFPHVGCHLHHQPFVPQMFCRGLWVSPACDIARAHVQDLGFTCDVDVSGTATWTPRCQRQRWREMNNVLLVVCFDVPVVCELLMPTTTQDLLASPVCGTIVTGTQMMMTATGGNLRLEVWLNTPPMFYMLICGAVLVRRSLHDFGSANSDHSPANASFAAGSSSGRRSPQPHPAGVPPAQPPPPRPLQQPNLQQQQHHKAASPVPHVSLGLDMPCSPP